MFIYKLSLLTKFSNSTSLFKNLGKVCFSSFLLYKFESLSSLNYNLNSPSSATNRKYLKIETEIILCALFWLVWGGEKETWNIKSGKRNLEYKIRKKKSGIHNQEKETWNIKSGKRNLEYKIRKKKPGI